jgi:hypothetical protein
VHPPPPSEQDISDLFTALPDMVQFETCYYKPAKPAVYPDRDIKAIHWDKRDGIVSVEMADGQSWGVIQSRSSPLLTRESVFYLVMVKVKGICSKHYLADCLEHYFWVRDFQRAAAAMAAFSCALCYLLLQRPFFTVDSLLALQPVALQRAVLLQAMLRTSPP